MKNKNIYLVISVVIVFISSILLVNNIIKGDDNNDHNNFSSNDSVKYDDIVTLKDSDGFSLKTEYYDYSANLIITSENFHSYVMAVVSYYDNENKLIDEAEYVFNLVNKSDNLLINISIDREYVKSISVKIEASVDQETATAYDKKKLNFKVEERKDNDTLTVNFSSDNTLKADLVSMKGYVLFYKDKKTLNVVPFQINNISKSEKIVSSVLTNLKNEYDEIKIHVNEII